MLLHNARLIDGTGAPPVASSLLIESGRIAALGEAADEAAHTNTNIERIDFGGATVMPGLIDAHCHLAFDALCDR